MICLTFQKQKKMCCWWLLQRSHTATLLAIVLHCFDLRLFVFVTSSAFSIFSVYNLLLVTTRQDSIDQRTSGKFCFRWRTFDKSPLRSKRNVSSFYVLLRVTRFVGTRLEFNAQSYKFLVNFKETMEYHTMCHKTLNTRQNVK